MNRTFIYSLLIVLALFFLAGCEREYETHNVSRVGYLPEFDFEGTEFITTTVGNPVNIPEVKATVKGEEVSWTELGRPQVDFNTAGVYLIYYFANNEDFIQNSAYRIVAVTYEDVSDNDLSGTYVGTLWTAMQSKVRKIDDRGLYRMEEIFGFPGAEMKGRFVDLGRNELVLLPGESIFGDYDIAEGSYTSSSLTWPVRFLDPPNEGVEIEVTWFKTQ